GALRRKVGKRTSILLRISFILPDQALCCPVARCAYTLSGGLVFSWTKQHLNLALDWLGRLLESKRRRFGLATRSSPILPGTRARRDYGRTCRTLLNQVISLGLLAAYRSSARLATLQ